MRSRYSALTVLWVAQDVHNNVKTHHAEWERGLQPVNTSLSPGAVAPQLCVLRFQDARQMRFHFSLNGWMKSQFRARHIFKTTSKERLRYVLGGKNREKFKSTNLAVFTEICPHAGAIPSSHQHMVDEEVCTWDAADELARNAVVVVA